MADAAKLNQQLSKIARMLNDVRETLFECSRESIKGEDNEWHKAEALFSLAKSVDGLRRQTLRRARRIKRITRTIKFEGAR